MEAKAGSHPSALRLGPAPARLLERRAELEVLSRALQGTSQGNGSLVLVHGHSGMGKSTLLDAAAALAADDGMRVLRAQGRRSEEGFPLGIARQLFEAHVGGAKRGERERILSGSARLAAQFIDGEPLEHPLPAGAVFSVIHGLFWLAANLGAERPLLLSVDDAELADPLSRRFLLYLAPRLEELPIALVLATGPSEAGLDRQELAELAAQPGATTLDPSPLSREATGELVRDHLLPGAPAEVVDALHRATAGNPALIRQLGPELAAHDGTPPAELALLAAEAGPRTVARAALARLLRRGEGAVSVARALAVLGEGAELRQLAALTGLGQGETAGLVDDLSQAGFMRQGSRGVAFLQPIVGRAIYLDSTPAQRADAHLRAAEALHDEGAQPEGTARHLTLARRAGNAWAVDALRRAAKRAAVAGRTQDAVDHLRRALDEPPVADQRAAVVLQLAQAEAVVGAPEAVARLLEAFELEPEGEQLVDATLATAHALHARGQRSEALDVLRRALALVSPESGLRGRLEAARAAVIRLAGARADAQLEGPSGLALQAFDAMAAGQPRARVIELGRAALDDGRLLEDETADGIAFHLATFALTVAEDFAVAAPAMTAAVEDARSRGSALGLATASYFRSHLHVRRGDLTAAEADLRTAIEAEARGWRLALADAHGLLADVLFERRDAAAGELELRLAAEADRGEPGLGLYLGAAARSALARGRTREALGATAAAREVLGSLDVANPAVAPFDTGAVAAEQAAGGEDEAVAVADAELKRARAFGAPGAVGRALVQSAAAAPPHDRVALLEEAVAVLEGSGAMLDEARALAELGTALRREGKRAAAREPLRRALDLAQRAGSDMLLGRVGEELATVGSRPRRTALSGVGALTPRERQVAELASAGMSNREIADSLFVTLKTVEWHLRHAFVKLGVGSREELAAAMGSAG